MNLTVGNDIGNSETKMIVGDEDTIIKQPSAIREMFKVPDAIEDDEQKNIFNLLDELVVNVQTKALRRPGLYFVGKRANQTAGNDVQNIDIDIGNKYKQDIPVIMTLSMLSAQAIQSDYQKNGQIPSVLELDIDMMTAIPSSEYSKEKAEWLQNRFLNHVHLINVHVGDKSVMVKITFNFVKVTQEGVPALYCFLDSNDNILSNYKEIYPNDGFQPTDMESQKVLHVDIGDGTTEFIYTRGVNPVVDACSGEKNGVGHATEKAKDLLKDDLDGHLDINRQQFVSILGNTDHNHHQLAKQYMNKTSRSQKDEIFNHVAKKYRNNAASDVDVIAVYGGGSIQFKSELYEDLKEFCADVKCKLLWVPEDYAVDMNVQGMKVLMEKVFVK